MEALGAIPAALNLTLRSAQAGFELQQAPKETRELFRTISSTRSDILLAKEKRIDLARICHASDIAEWDRSIKELESALNSLEKLVEPSRVDMQVGKGKVRLRTKAMWVLRDSKSLSATNDRLNLAYARMGFCYQRLQLAAAQAASSEQRNSPPEPVEQPPPSYQASTSKAVAARRKDERERLERSESVNSISHNSEPDNAGGRHPPTFSVHNGLQHNVSPNPPHLRRGVTTSAVHLPSDGAYQRNQALDRSEENIPLQPPPLHPRSVSMPYLHPNSAIHGRAETTPKAELDHNPRMLSSNVGDFRASPPLNMDQSDLEVASIFSFEQRHLGREDPVGASPRFGFSSSTTLRGTPEPFGPNYLQTSLYQAAPQPPQRFSSNSATPKRRPVQPSSSSQRVMPPYPVSRNTTVQSRQHPHRSIPEVDEDTPPASPPQSAPPLQHLNYNYDDSYDDMYDSPPPSPPKSALDPVPAGKSFPTPDRVVKTQHLFAGQRETKEIQYKPYFDSETMGTTRVSDSYSGLSPPPPPPAPQKYAAYRPYLDRP